MFFPSANSSLKCKRIEHYFYFMLFLGIICWSFRECEKTNYAMRNNWKLKPLPSSGNSKETSKGKVFYTEKPFIMLGINLNFFPVKGTNIFFFLVEVYAHKVNVSALVQKLLMIFLREKYH